MKLCTSACNKVSEQKACKILGKIKKRAGDSSAELSRAKAFHRRGLSTWHILPIAGSAQSLQPVQGCLLLQLKSKGWGAQVMAVQGGDFHYSWRRHS